jgi:hypothetical protein
MNEVYGIDLTIQLRSNPYTFQLHDVVMTTLQVIFVFFISGNTKLGSVFSPHT